MRQIPHLNFTQASASGGLPWLPSGLCRGLAACLVLGLFIGHWGCARNPVSGRLEAVLTSEDAEIEQGNQLAKLVESEIGLVENPGLETYLSQLGQRLASHSPRGDITYQFQVANMPEANAFALPGGRIYVSRGLLPLLNSEDELAAVLGHEIGHVAARHSVRRQTASAPLAPLRIATALGGATASIVSPGLGQLVAGLGEFPGAFAMAAYSRDQEREADRLGQQIAAAAGFDPMALSVFTETLAREEALSGEPDRRGSFLVSHPPSPDRSAAAEKYAHGLSIQPSLPAPLDRKNFLHHFEGILLGQPAIEGVFVDNRFLHPELGIGFSFPSNWETLNTKNSVSARSPDGSADLILEIVGKGASAMEAAENFAEKVKFKSGPHELRVNELDAAEASLIVRVRGENNQLALTWFSYNDLIYQFTGIAPAHAFAKVRADFENSSRSFHPLSENERSEIFENRLRVIESGTVESLAELGQRSGNQWSPAQTAVANGVQQEEPLPPSWPVKISNEEPYRGPDPPSHQGPVKQISDPDADQTKIES